MEMEQTIKDVADSVKGLSHAEKIILISRKFNTGNELTGFKLCVIVGDEVESLSELEAKLYMTIECEIPFDLVMYQKSKWNSMRKDTGSFAWKICDIGTVIYG
jgi:membrane glycosyltransferase